MGLFQNSVKYYDNNQNSHRALVWILISLPLFHLICLFLSSALRWQYTIIFRTAFCVQASLQQAPRWGEAPRIQLPRAILFPFPHFRRMCLMKNGKTAMGTILLHVLYKEIIFIVLIFGGRGRYANSLPIYCRKGSWTMATRSMKWLSCNL